MTIGIFSYASKCFFLKFWARRPLRFPAVFRPPGSAIDPWAYGSKERVSPVGFTRFSFKKKNEPPLHQVSFESEPTEKIASHCRMSFLPRWRSNQD